jgi:hypothetical protein
MVGLVVVVVAVFAEVVLVGVVLVYLNNPDG